MGKFNMKMTIFGTVVAKSKTEYGHVWYQCG